MVLVIKSNRQGNRSFIGQAPVLLFAFLLCFLYLPNTSSTTPDKDFGLSNANRLAEIDFLGSGVLSLLILAFMLPMEIGGTKIPWSHPLISSLFALAAILLFFFVLTEKWWAKQPILPLQLFERRDIVASFFIMALQVAAQIGVRSYMCYPFSFPIHTARG
jgi:hypothetical protein